MSASPEDASVGVSEIGAMVFSVTSTWRELLDIFVPASAYETGQRVNFPVFFGNKVRVSWISEAAVPFIIIVCTEEDVPRTSKESRPGICRAFISTEFASFAFNITVTLTSSERVVEVLSDSRRSDAFELAAKAVAILQKKIQKMLTNRDISRKIYTKYDSDYSENIHFSKEIPEFIFTNKHKNI
jgi:hypothetical protein